MDDLVYVQIACTDLSLFQKFIYPILCELFFDERLSRAAEFIGAGVAFLIGGHFELQAIAVKKVRENSCSASAGQNKAARGRGRSAEQRELERFICP